jgi:hypothetical protein
MAAASALSQSITGAGRGVVGAGGVQAVQQEKKINLYNQMAQVLMGNNVDGSIRNFDQDGDLTGGTNLEEVFIVSFSRLLSKDEIKKGSFTMTMYTGSSATGSVTDDPGPAMTLSDYNGENGYKVNSPAGEYGLLLTSSTSEDYFAAGLLFYQAGIAVITASIFRTVSGYNNFTADAGIGYGPSGGSGKQGPAGGNVGSGSGHYLYLGSALTTSMTTENMLLSQSISGACDAFRTRLKSISFNNTTELNSTIYFCRANHNEFNYSANPTYLDSSKIVVKNNSSDLPVTYVTTIGLYSSDNELLAMAKLSEPLKKDPNTELTLRVRLDY